MCAGRHPDEILQFQFVSLQVLVVSAGLVSPILSVPFPEDPAPAAEAAPAANSKSAPAVATTRTHHKKHGFGGLYGGGLGYGAGLG